MSNVNNRDDDFDRVITQIQCQKRTEVSAAPVAAPPMTGETTVLASQKRLAIDEPPAAVKTDPLR